MTVKKVFDFNRVFDTMFYPAGEPHIRLKVDFIDGGMINGWYRPWIIAQAANWDDLATIRIGHSVLHDNGIEATFVIPYMPFSRHDRKNDYFDSMPMGLVREILDTVHVVTVDPHSDVTSAWFPSYPQSEVVKLYEAAGIFDNNAMIAIPDAGATKKVHSWLGGRDVVQCLKTRDTKTGKLSGFEVIHPEMVDGRNVVIIDDICDGGGTFIGLADKLLEAGAYSLRLGVTHGLFTKGLGVLEDYYTRIYTLDTCIVSNAGLFRVSTEELIMEGNYF